MIQLDDHGMMLVRVFLTSFEDMKSTIAQIPEWRVFRLVSEDEWKYHVYSQDFVPRFDDCIVAATSFIAHYHLLKKHRDVPITRNLQWHLRIDEMADWKIEGVKLGFRGWIVREQAVAYLIELANALQLCKHQRRAASRL